MKASNRMSLAEYRQKVGLGPVQKAPVVATRTEGPAMDGRRVYDSKLNARLASRLEDERRVGGLISYIPEVSIPVGIDEFGRNVRHRIDQLAVLEVRADGTFIGKFIEAKGRDLPAGRAKRSTVRSLYGVPVHVVRAV